MHVVGFEGTMSEDAALVWAAAALTDGTFLINPTTDQRVDLSAKEELEAAGALTSIKTSIEVNVKHATYPLIAVIIRHAHPLCGLALIDTGKMGGLVGHAGTKDFHYYIFRDEVAFELYAREIIARVIGKILYTTPAGNDNRGNIDELLRLGLVLDHSDPVLNALRVHTAGQRRASALKLARSNLRTANARDSFETFLAACDDAGAEHVLKYEKGAAQGGGFDVNVAVTALRSIEALHEEMAPALLHIYPFLEPPSSPRFSMMRAASAEMHFTTAIEGKALGDRVGRYLELLMLSSVIKGDLPKGLAQTKKLEMARAAVIQPAPETTLRLKPVNAAEIEVVELTPSTRANAERSLPFCILGFQSGAINDTARIEVHIAPKRRLVLSSEKDGTGGRPIGVEFLRTESDFLFKPALITVIQERDNASGRETLYLQSMVILDVGVEGDITALPSSIVRGSYLVDLSIAVQRSDENTLSLTIGTLNGFEDPRKLSSAESWLRAYKDMCFETEIRRGSDEDATWLTPCVRPEPSPLHRILVALGELGGRAHVKDLTALIAERFNASVRDNNTRREVIKHKDLLRFNLDDPKVIEQTELGYLYLRAYINAGGDIGGG